MALLEAGEKVHVIERRQFEGDARRHFMGEIEACVDGVARATGYTFVCNPGTGNFDRRDPKRTRIVPLADARIVVYVIPREIDVEQARYEWAMGGRLVVRSGPWELYLDEFASARY